MQIPQSNPNILVLLNDPFVFTHRKLIVEAANKQQLPGVYGFRVFVDDEDLSVHGWICRPNFKGGEARHSSCPVADQIWKWSSTLKAGKSLSITIPPNLLATADDVIQD